jgi:hypothetical protein
VELETIPSTWLIVKRLKQIEGLNLTKKLVLEESPTQAYPVNFRNYEFQKPKQVVSYEKHHFLIE